MRRSDCVDPGESVLNQAVRSQCVNLGNKERKSVVFIDLVNDEGDDIKRAATDINEGVQPALPLGRLHVPSHLGHKLGSNLQVNEVLERSAFDQRLRARFCELLRIGLQAPFPGAGSELLVGLCQPCVLKAVARRTDIELPTQACASELGAVMMKDPCPHVPQHKGDEAAGPADARTRDGRIDERKLQICADILLTCSGVLSEEN